MDWWYRFWDWLNGTPGYGEPDGEGGYDYVPYADVPYERVEYDGGGSPWATVYWKDGTTSRMHDDEMP